MNEPSKLIKCRTLYNESRWLPAEQFVQRASVYGVVITEGHLLVARASYTHKFVLPGGGVEVGEAMEDFQTHGALILSLVQRISAGA